MLSLNQDAIKRPIYYDSTTNPNLSNTTTTVRHSKV